MPPRKRLRFGSEASAAEQSGAEQSGAAPSAAELSGAEQSGAKQSRAAASAAEQSGDEQSGAAAKQPSAAKRAKAAKAKAERSPVVNAAPMKKPAAQVSGAGFAKASKFAPNAADDICDRFAKLFCAVLLTKQPQKLKNAQYVVQRFGTLQHLSGCTGTNVGWLSTNALVKALGGEPVAVAFGCEIDKPKATFGREVTFSHEDGDPNTCIYSDICKLASRKCHCYTHDKECPFPKIRSNASVADIGFSCKLLSKLFKDCHHSGSVCAEGRGSTGETSDGMLSTLGEFTPLIAIMENVAELLNPQFANWAWIRSKMQESRYSTSGSTRNCKDYGRKLDRLRAWGANLYMEQLRSHATGQRLTAIETELLHDAIWETMDLLKLGDDATPPLSDSILPPGDALVKSEFRRQKTYKGQEEDSAEWKDKHHKFIKSEAMRMNDLLLQEPHLSSPWVQHIFQGREKQCLAYALAKLAKSNEHKQQQGQATVSLTTLDVYQSIDRLFYGRDGVCGNLAPGMRTYLIDEERFLLGYEALSIQGYPVNLIDGWLKQKKKTAAKSKTAAMKSAKTATTKPNKTAKTTKLQPPSEVADNNLWRDMSGNMFPMTVHMALLLSILANLPEIDDDDEGEDEMLDLHAVATIGLR